jgi:nicotinamidase-related amidase
MTFKFVAEMCISAQSTGKREFARQAQNVGRILALRHSGGLAAIFIADAGIRISVFDMSCLVAAEPYPFVLVPDQSALLVIDMQRDFLEPGGFGEMLGNDVSHLRRTIAPNRALLEAWRAADLLAIHTREGHRPDLADLPPAKQSRGRGKMKIGDQGPMGRILVRGEPGHAIIAELAPLPGEPVIDKPGKGAFFATDLHAILQNRGIKQLVVTGVTTEVCVHTTVREANDRGYECLVLEDCVGSYFPEFQKAALAMIKAQGGIFGWVATSRLLIDALANSRLGAN